MSGAHLNRCWKNVLEADKPGTRKISGELVAGFFPVRQLGPLSAAAKSLQPCPTLCDPIDGSPPGSAVPGILQARTLEWVAISLLQCMKVNSEREVAQSCLTLSDPVDSAYPAPPPVGLSRPEDWSGEPLSGGG